MPVTQVKSNCDKSLIRNGNWDVYARMRAGTYVLKANIEPTASSEA
jgi:hypothetical protein